MNTNSTKEQDLAALETWFWDTVSDGFEEWAILTNVFATYIILEGAPIGTAIDQVGFSKMVRNRMTYMSVDWELVAEIYGSFANGYSCTGVGPECSKPSAAPKPGDVAPPTAAPFESWTDDRRKAFVEARFMQKVRAQVKEELQKRGSK